MATVRRLRFLKFNFLTVGALVRRILLHRTKFRKARSNRCGDIAIFVIFKMAASANLDYKKSNFYGRSAVRGQLTSAFHISPESVKRFSDMAILRSFFQNGGRPPFWIFARMLTDARKVTR